ncbi:hypothetical protein [Dactylosporangium sp. NPDC000521]|uniref:hypothetical protein n=1 Tax=Dactylosporangium sp. NPDC000521 TaxID=3363975 RepID=UPI00367CBE84
MADEHHPEWCTRTACTAYGVDQDGYHRSEPHIIATIDPTISVVIHKGADPDGTGEYVELAEVTLTPDEPWHLSEPVLGREFLFSRAAVDAVRHALAELA